MTCWLPVQNYLAATLHRQKRLQPDKCDVLMRVGCCQPIPELLPGKAQAAPRFIVHSIAATSGTCRAYAGNKTQQKQSLRLSHNRETGNGPKDLYNVVRQGSSGSRLSSLFAFVSIRENTIFFRVSLALIALAPARCFVCAPPVATGC